MNESEPNFSALLAEAFPSAEAGTQLEDRILAQVSDRHRRSQARTSLPVAGARISRRAIRFGFATAGLGLAALGLIVLTPRALAFAEFRRMEAAADALPEWRVLAFTPNMAGTLVQSGETWCRHGQVLEEREFGQVEILRSGHSVIEYRKGEDHAIRSAGNDVGGQVKKLSGFIRELQSSTSLMGMTLDRNVAIEGRMATRVSALARNEPVRISIYADSETDAPFLALVETHSESGWRVIRKLTIDATPNIASAVTFDLPKDIRIVDQSSMQQEWERKLGSPIATYPGPSGAAPILIRDVWMNRDGIVFVMYSNGRSQRPVDMSGWKSRTLPNGTKVYENPHPVASATPSSDLESVQDERGTQYAKLEAFQGFETSTDGKWNRGLTWPSGDAMVSVYAPTTPVEAARRRIKLSFGYTNFIVPKGFKPRGNSVSVSEMTPNHVVEAVHEQTLEPHPVQLPEWVDYIGIFPTPLDMDAEVARVRGVAAIARGDGAAAESYARDYLRLTQMEAAESGNSFQMSDRYDLLGQAHSLEGRSDEAIQAWKQALDDAQPPDRERIEKEIADHKAIPR